MCSPKGEKQAHKRLVMIYIETGLYHLFVDLWDWYNFKGSVRTGMMEAVFEFYQELGFTAVAQLWVQAQPDEFLLLPYSLEAKVLLAIWER